MLCISLAILLVIFGLQFSLASKVPLDRDREAPKRVSKRWLQEVPILEQLLDEEVKLIERFVKHRRLKRGIVLIDEDFDVPPKVEAKQEWSDRNADKRSRSVVPETSKNKRLSTGTLAAAITSEISFTKRSQISETSYQVTQRADLIGEGSGSENDGSPTSQSVPGMSQSLLANSKSHFTEIEEGSGDDTSITNDLIETSDVPMGCLDSTCDTSDLFTAPELVEKVPEGVNVSLICTNVRGDGNLRWYKRNSSDNLHFQVDTETNETRLDIIETQLHHSGTYVCVLSSSKQSCCHKLLEIIVYEVPNYKFHLIVIGVIAGVVLAVCVVFGFLKKHNIKKAKRVELEMNNLEKPFLS